MTTLDPIPREPWSADVRVWRNGDTAQPCGASIPRTVVWHSPDGFNFGYGGSGPADLALNILNAFVPPGREIDWEDENDDPDRDDAPTKCYQGVCSRFAQRHHQDFKREFIAPMSGDGGTIAGATIRQWIDERRGKAGSQICARTTSS